MFSENVMICRQKVQDDLDAEYLNYWAIGNKMASWKPAAKLKCS